MDSNIPNITPDVQYNDGVVCFGPMTDSELEKRQRLPRYTVVPSDMILSNEYFDSDEDKCYKNNTNDNVSFSSPSTSQILPSDDKLIETDVINRYIRMEAASDESKSFSEDQFDFEAASYVDDKDKEEESILDSFVCENVGFVDAQKTEVIHENSTRIKNPATPLESVPSVIEPCNNENEKNVSEVVNNVCTLKYSSQKESNESVCTDSEFEDSLEDYSIVPDKYSITPGKQRLFDVRRAKSSFHVKSCSVSAPFMDKIDETTCPIVSNSVLIDDSLIPSVVETLDTSLSVNDIDCSSSELDLNAVNRMVSDHNINNVIDNTNRSVELINCSVEDRRTLDNLKCSINLKRSTNELINILPKSFIDQSHVNDENKPVATKLVNTTSDETCNNTFLTNNESIQFNKSLNNSNVGIDSYDLEICKNIMPNTNVLGTLSNDMMCTNKLSSNSKSLTHNKSFNETNQSGNFLHAAVELKSDLEESNEPKIIIPAVNDEDILLNENNFSNSSDVNRFKVPPRNITNFDQSQVEKCKNISTVNSTLNAFDDNCCHQFLNNISVLEQTICSEMTDIENKNDLSLDKHLKSKLSTIIEICTLEEEIMSQSYDREKFVNDTPVHSISDNILSVDTNNEMLIKLQKEELLKIKAIKSEDGLNNHTAGLSLINVTKPLEMETENDSYVTKECVNNSGVSFNESKDFINNILSINDGVYQNETNIIVEGNNQFENKITKRNTENHDWSFNSLSQNNSISTSVLNTSELLLKSKNAMKNIQQDHVLNNTNSLSNSLIEFNKIEQMLLEEDKKVFEFKTPKTEKLLDFSIEQQSPFLISQGKKQKLVNFSIVEQTPTPKCIQHTSFNHNHKKTDTLIDFSSVGQMLDLGIVSETNIDFQESSSNRLMNISAPNIELLSDESIKTSSADHNNLSFNQTVTETNLNNTDNNIEKFPEKYDSIVLTNKQIEVNESSNALNKTIAQNEQYIKEPTSVEHKQGSELFCTPLNTKSVDSNQKSILNSNKYNIVDFSIVKQSLKQKNNETITSVESNNIASNLIDASVTSVYNTTSNNQSNTPMIVVSSYDEPEKTLNSCSTDDGNNTVIHFKDSQLIYKEALTDVQINDVSLLVETPDKSSVSESFHSIELDHVQEDKKRKIEPLGESHINEKKIKVDTEEELKTPSSMLYKIRNMFRSSEKQLHHSRNEENSLRSINVSCQKLNFCKYEENKASFAKPSKIPCKVTDISLTKNSEFNLSTSLLNDNIVKSKKTIPKLTGLPVLSDVSNASTKKNPESRIPSKVQK